MLPGTTTREGIARSHTGIGWETKESRGLCRPPAIEIREYITPRSDVPGVLVRRTPGFSGSTQVFGPLAAGVPPAAVENVSLTEVTWVQFRADILCAVIVDNITVAEVPSGQIFEVICERPSQVRLLPYSTTIEPGSARIRLYSPQYHAKIEKDRTGQASP